jgi:hypothetical protein
MIKELQDVITKLRGHNPKAADFLVDYITYCSLVDDCVDEHYAATRIQRITELAFKSFNCEYWRQYSHILSVTERLMHNSYFDSLVWEEEKGWKGEYSKFMAQCGCQMVFAVVLIEFGEQYLNQISLDFRQAVYEKHEKE